jgi:hypothetical protein
VKTFYGVLLATAMAATGLATGALANDKKPGLEDFIACDRQGYPERDDGYGDVSVEAIPLAGRDSELFPVRARAVLGGTRAGACDRALQNPALLPQQFPRRANLLRARAFHEAKMGEFDHAMASLDAADAELAKTPVWIDQDSFLTGSDMLRAHLLIEKGNKADAAAIVTRFAARWPHSDMLQAAAQSYRMRIDGSRDNELALLDQRNTRSPMFLYRQVARASAFGKYDVVDRLAGLIRTTPPEPLPGWTPSPRPRDQDPLVLDAQMAGLWAYAALVQGHPADAAPRLDAMRARVAATMTPPPPPPEGKQQRKSVIEDYQLRLSIAGHANRALDQWAAAIKLRGEISTMESEVAFAKIETGNLPPPAILDLIRTLALLDKDNPDAKAAIGQFETMIDGETEKTRYIDLTDVYRAVPDLMTKAELPGFKRSDGIWTNENGYSAKREGPEGSDIWTVRFTHAWAPAHVVDELLEMACAKYARDKGYDGFILLNRQLIQRNYTGYINAPAGYEAGARVRFVRKAALPAELEGERWRIVDASTTFDEIYAKHFAQQAKIKAEKGYKLRP